MRRCLNELFVYEACGSHLSARSFFQPDDLGNELVRVFERIGIIVLGSTRMNVLDKRPLQSLQKFWLGFTHMSDEIQISLMSRIRRAGYHDVKQLCSALTELVASIAARAERGDRSVVRS